LLLLTSLFTPPACRFWFCLQVLENKEYSLADTYPRYLVLPALMTKDEIRIAAGAIHSRVHALWIFTPEL
jgi:hypothetical protein